MSDNDMDGLGAATTPVWADNGQGEPVEVGVALVLLREQDGRVHLLKVSGHETFCGRKSDTAFTMRCMGRNT